VALLVNTILNTVDVIIEVFLLFKLKNSGKRY